MQPDNMGLEIEGGYAANQLARHVEIAGQIQQDNVWLGLAQPDFESLVRGIRIELGEDLKDARRVDGSRELVCEFPVWNDGQRCQNRPPGCHCVLLIHTPACATFTSPPGWI